MTEAGRGIATAPDAAGVGRLARARAGRRAFAVGLTLFLCAGALGLLGVRTTTATAAGGGYELTVTYAAVSRPGLATPWSFEVRRPGGFPDGLTVAVTSRYLDAFDENGLSPAPAQEWADGDRTVWGFAPQVPGTLSVSFDARMEPGVQLATVHGEVAVLAGPTGPPVATVAFRTFVMP